MCKLNLLVIRSDQPEQVAHFYEHLGLTFEYHRHGKGPLHYSSVCEDMVFEIYPLLKRQTEADISIRLGFHVSHLDALLEKLKAQDIAIIQEPQRSEWGYQAIVKDPDGRKIELTET